MTTEARIPLSRERVLRAAVGLADEHGLRAVTMRRLAEELGAEAMSLYYHVAKKEDVLDGIVEVVAEEINEAVARVEVSGGWQRAVRQRILTAREVFLRHRWAPALFEARSSTSLAVLRHYDTLVGLMRDGGFSHDQIHHALHALGSRALGFSQELFDPGSDASAEVPPELAAQLPNLVGMLSEIAHDDPDSTLGWCDDQTEFEFGLDLILDGLDRLR
ncbi:TetR/AcrR family transcriptional regulator C-terminal domain-containing protein [Amycolatopsis sp. OK19-0408]|uniref:TetR/AcrR family transcriptional regulator C-terminal domain-containing protein n=1 Tax=Amycolatopsis iheyensis TaxID=2945988 RepID=A0A9X2NFB3_9PSEU|nr:TetR/AcrR family transcriptional regulator C-terminal domain-containing protein [Amycolatopsis iheyensis]MCR6485659.1 TetR/AcrR family transcriptional regulator C-terminal domain-containing protein [Amycolatopsis iheyensis]